MYHGRDRGRLMYTRDRAAPVSCDRPGENRSCRGMFERPRGVRMERRLGFLFFLGLFFLASCARDEVSKEIRKKKDRYVEEIEKILKWKEEFPELRTKEAALEADIREKRGDMTSVEGMRRFMTAKQKEIPLGKASHFSFSVRRQVMGNSNVMVALLVIFTGTYEEFLRFYDAITTEGPTKSPLSLKIKAMGDGERYKIYLNVVSPLRDQNFRMIHTTIRRAEKLSEEEKKDEELVQLKRKYQRLIEDEDRYNELKEKIVWLEELKKCFALFPERGRSVRELLVSFFSAAGPKARIDTLEHVEGRISAIVNCGARGDCEEFSRKLPGFVEIVSREFLAPVEETERLFLEGVVDNE